MGGFLIPEDEGGRYGIHGLDVMHNPGGEPGGEIRDQGGGIFCFIIFGVDNIQLECIDIFLELLSSVDVSGGQPIHGFPSGVGIDKGSLKVLLKLGECSEQQGGQSLLAADFCPYGGRSLLHVRQGEGDLSVVIIV